MKKTTLVIVTLLVMCGLAYGQEVQKNGIEKKYFESGELKEEMPYKKGKIDGTRKKYHMNGQVSLEVTYRNGEIVGPKKTYYENGQLKSETLYQNSQKEGDYTEYYENGEIRRIHTYKNRKLVHKKTFDEKGKLVSDEDTTEAEE